MTGLVGLPEGGEITMVMSWFRCIEEGSCMVLSDIGSVCAAVGLPRLAFCIILLIGLRTACPRRRAFDAWAFGRLLGSGSAVGGLKFLEENILGSFLLNRKKVSPTKRGRHYIDKVPRA
jgi:hypothetical protein